MFADDLVLLCHNLRAANRIMALLHGICSHLGINVNFGKSKIMCLSSDTSPTHGLTRKCKLADEISQGLTVGIGGAVLDKTDTFCYLGHMVAKDGGPIISDPAIKYSQQQERKAICKIKTLLKITGPSPRWRSDLMKIFGISSLLHGCEGMIFTVARLKALDVPLTEERLLITGGTRPRTGKVGHQQQNYVLVQKTKRLYPSHVWDVAVKQRLNFVLNNIYEVSSSRSLRVLLSSPLTWYQMQASSRWARAKGCQLIGPLSKRTSSGPREHW